MNPRVVYWMELAEYDIETADAMLKSRRFLYVGFMCHQAVEKMLKAYYVRTFDLHPPKTHNLRMIAQKCDLLKSLAAEQIDFLISLEPLNIEARYPTDKDLLFKALSQEKCRDILENSRDLLSWIKSKL